MGYILLFLMLFAGQAQAANCIVDKDNNVVAKITYSPNIKDLDSRGEAVVKCDDSIQIGDADFRNNKVVKHIQTKKEADDISDRATKKAAREAAHASAINKLKTLGLTDDEISALTGGN